MHSLPAAASCLSCLAVAFGMTSFTSTLSHDHVFHLRVSYSEMWLLARVCGRIDEYSLFKLDRQQIYY
jgi:hypothetical protein